MIRVAILWMAAEAMEAMLRDGLRRFHLGEFLRLADELEAATISTNDAVENPGRGECLTGGEARKGEGEPVMKECGRGQGERLRYPVLREGADVALVRRSVIEAGFALPRGAGVNTGVPGPAEPAGQDAAHRAGFNTARTWPSVLRAAGAQVVAERDGISLSELAGPSGGDGAVVTWWTDPDANPGAFDPERFVAEFLAPDRHWLRDFARLQREGRLPPKSDLKELVANRPRWETLAELGYRSTIGRTLERTRAAAVGVDRERFERAAAKAHLRLREEFGSLRGITEETVQALLLGILRRMREHGRSGASGTSASSRREHPSGG